LPFPSTRERQIVFYVIIALVFANTLFLVSMFLLGSGAIAARLGRLSEGLAVPKADDMP
jgi:hypothetical protein